MSFPDNFPPISKNLLLCFFSRLLSISTNNYVVRKAELDRRWIQRRPGFQEERLFLSALNNLEINLKIIYLSRITSFSTTLSLSVVFFLISRVKWSQLLEKRLFEVLFHWTKKKKNSLPFTCSTLHVSCRQDVFSSSILCFVNDEKIELVLRTLKIIIFKGEIYYFSLEYYLFINKFIISPFILIISKNKNILFFVIMKCRFQVAW